MKQEDGLRDVPKDAGMIGEAFLAVAGELNAAFRSGDAPSSAAPPPCCLVYIYPNAKRLVWQQRLLSKVLSAARNGRDTFYCTNAWPCWGKSLPP
jgi:hypothetical protein